MPGGSNWIPCSTRSDPPSVPRVRADCGGRLFTAKLSVVVHNLAHQLFDHLLANDAILLARQFCDCLRDRINDVIASSVSTLSEPACPIPQSWSQEPVHVGVEVGITPGRVKRWHDRHRAHTLPRDPVSACLPPTPLHRCIGLRVRSLNDPHDARLRPFNRHTLEPAAASRCEPTHPSPSAR